MAKTFKNYVSDWSNDSQRRYELSKYGLTQEDYLFLLKSQDFRCAICLRKQLNRRLAVDHCHKTDKIRGLLCSRCNLGIGSFEDDIDLLNKVIAYLRSY